MAWMRYLPERTFFMKRPLSILLSCCLFASVFTRVSAQGKAAVHEQRIEQRIRELARFGKDSLGRGYRVAYTKGDIEGRAWFIGLMKEAGLQVRIDEGNYDGCVGSIGGLEVMELLKAKGMTTRHPLELIIFSNEEGGTIGSMAMAGSLTAAGLNQVSQSGLTMGEGISVLGGDPDRIQQAVRRKGDLEAYLELHIEQGGILDKEKINIGVVEGIVGIVHWEVTVEGFANHAGTTPMDMRKDALLAASKLVVAVNEVVTGVDGRQVGTIGKLSVQPGAYNVIPGKVTMGLEIRDLSYEKIWQLFREIEKRAASIASSSGVKISFREEPNQSRPAIADKSLQALIVRSAETLKYSHRFMQSGAGHDAQEMAHIAPVAMIFIPSIGGISHSPKEFSTPADMARGAQVLLETVLFLDAR